MWIFGGIIGMVIGASIAGFSGWFAGMILGGVFGMMIKQFLSSGLSEINNKLLELEKTVQNLHKRMDVLQKGEAVTPVSPAYVAPAVTAVSRGPEPTLTELQPAALTKPLVENNSLQPAQKPIQQAEKSIPASSATRQASVAKSEISISSPSVTIKAPELINAPQEPNWLDRFVAKAIDAIKQFIFGGNTLVKVGSLILFLGLAFLLRYAASQITVPIELRYGGVAAAALALLGFGWHLRLRRREYALVLQGLAIGVLYLTLFAAMKIHPLLPLQLGFALMVVVCVSAAVLAVKQNSLSLAMAGSLGGFATPILASTGSGNHVALFSYIALLDAGIMAVAWFRAWRVLNLVGFFGTFGLFMAWFSRSWQEQHLVSAELFLVLFFVMFVGILIRFAHHLSLSAEMAPASDAERDGVLLNITKKADYIDGTLAFGVPLVAFGLHAQMMTQHEFGASFGALAFGAFYLGLAAVLRQFTQKRYLLLIEIFISLGVVFATLAIPLGLEPQWSASAWAIEAAGIFWIGIRQKRPLARAFALLLLLGSIVNFFRTLYIGTEIGGAVLDGSIFGCCLIAASLLIVYWLLRNAPAGSVSANEKVYAWIAALGGTLMVYLLPPLLLSWEHCGMAWAILGLLTLYLALRFVLPVCIWAGFLIQLFAGVAFVTTLQGGADATVLGNGYRGLFSALLIGGSLLAGAWMATAKMRQAGPEMAGALRVVGVVTVVGLSLLNMAFLFVLPLQSALTAWALTSTLIVALALRMENRVALWFAIVLELLAGLMLLTHRVVPGLYSAQQADLSIQAFQHSGWWSALVFSLCGFVGAWLFKRCERKNETVPIPNAMMLLWGALWWAFAWGGELQRWLPEQKALPALVVALLITQLLWWAVSRWQDWAELRQFTYSHLPLAVLLTLITLFYQSHPFANYGWLVWPLAAVTHFFLLHGHDKLSGDKWQTQWHVAGVWWILILASFETRWHFAELGDQYSAWPKLGWALVPLAYMWWAGNWSRSSPWPMTRFLDDYRKTAAMPVAVVLSLWLVLSNFISNGTAQPLPYVPLLNPLELTLVAGMLVIMQWLRSQSSLNGHGDIATLDNESRHARFPHPNPPPEGEGTNEALREYQVNELNFHQRAGLLAYAFLCLTAGVFRAVHHWAGVPWQFETMLESILLQVSLSVVWSVVACTLMLLASRKAKREMWIAGAVLIAVVVAKLFLVELSHTGTVERIVSFMVVGVLLLVLGYFAPVPPKKNLA